MFTTYDVIVVGGGHAGCEAAAAAANMGSRVLLVTMNLQTIGQMSCNPAMGGVAKGQIVREIDALGGLSGIVADKSAIQFRMLNRSKGPAMWSPRTQNDRMLFAATWRNMLEKIPNLDFWQDMVGELLVEAGRIVGVKTSLGLEIKAQTVILTNGTFLNGLIHVGAKQFGGGRMGDRKATGLTEQLVKLGFTTGRMKTGTPPRVDSRSLDYKVMEEQKGDLNPQKFSFLEDIASVAKQRSCHITYTNPTVHATLAASLDQSPMYNGTIQSQGPRYCPSIEDKIHRFADKERHQLFVEPEGWDTVEVYVNGFSTSLPEDIQFKALRQIVGFEKAKMLRPGYAIEYDYFHPTQLSNTLETRLVEGLFFAGQINGTTGYEEAGCQGLWAGVNAHQQVHGGSPFVLSRAQAYMGVLVDDLINKGTEEPYRMFTSRAEFRILLRQDNADLRLTAIGHALGLATAERMAQWRAKEAALKQLMHDLATYKVPPAVNAKLQDMGSAPIHERQALQQLLKRPELDVEQLVQLEEGVAQCLGRYASVVQEQAAIQVKYESYIRKEEEFVAKLQKLENKAIPTNFNYDAIKGLSAEGREKLKRIQPATVGQATRISGVSSADISILLVYMGR